MKYIELTQDKRAVVDDSDYEYLSQWSWYYKESTGGGYAARNTRDSEGVRTTMRMHRQIMAASKSEHVDHKNGDKLDNRRNNLRFADMTQNMWNRKKQSGSSIYKGVTWNKKEKRWRAQIQINKKKIILGRFKSEYEAGKAYMKSAREHFGEFTRLA